MSVSKIQQRAFCVALVTLVGAAAMVLLYWQGVRKGVLPSPVQPLVASPPPIERKMASMSAREPAPAPPMANHAEVATPPKVTHAAVPPPAAAPWVAAVAQPTAPKVPPATTAMTNAAPAEPVPRPIEAKAPEKDSGQPPASKISAADQEQATRWLANTNQRPVVRVHYDAADILQLATARRGVIVAASKKSHLDRELYLQSPPQEAPLFAPFTKGVADGYSTYSLTLDPSPAFARLSAVLPAYFPNGADELVFIPDQSLATEIFAQVAQANRTMTTGGQPLEHRIFEGQLTLEGTKPRFEVMEVRTQGNRDLANLPAAQAPASTTSEARE